MVEFIGLASLIAIGDTQNTIQDEVWRAERMIYVL